MTTNSTPAGGGNRKPCPDCNSWLAARATRCPCGWQDRAMTGQGPAAAARAETRCSTLSCPNPATLMLEIQGRGLCNVCQGCAVAQRQAEADRFARERGLDQQPGESREAWVARQRAYIRDRLARVIRRRDVIAAGPAPEEPKPTRQPGEDEDFTFSGASFAQNVNGAFTEGGAIAPEAGGSLPPYAENEAGACGGIA